MAFVAATVLNTVANQLGQPAAASQAVPVQKRVDASVNGVPSAPLPDAGNLAGAIDRKVAGHVAVAARHASDPAARRDCHRRGLLFHLCIVGVILALLWLAYLGLKFFGDEDDHERSSNQALQMHNATAQLTDREIYGCPGCTYYPWPLSLQLIATVGLLQSLVAHYVSTAPCRGQGGWVFIVLGNLCNAVVFIWMVWLILAITSPGSGLVWPLVVTIFAGAAACITAAASWLFCSPQEPENEPCQGLPTGGP